MAIDAIWRDGYDVHMEIGTAELRNRLSFYLRLVRRGRRVVVTDRGRPVAQLVPFASGNDDLHTRIAEMAAEGVVSAQPVRKRREIRPVALHRANVRASRLVSEMRDER